MNLQDFCHQQPLKILIKNTKGNVVFRGPIFRVRLAKFFTYNIGMLSYKTSINKLTLTEDDSGWFWITDKWIGFKGSKRAFSFGLGKIHAIEKRGGNLLAIFKEGKEYPYIIKLENAERPFQILHKGL